MAGIVIQNHINRPPRKPCLVTVVCSLLVLSVAMAGWGGTKLYLNGGLVASNATGTSQLTKDNFTIGARPDNNGTFHFHGLIDDVRVYDYPMSRAEIAAFTVVAPFAARKTAGAESPGPRPNVVFVLTDQWRAQATAPTELKAQYPVNSIELRPNVPQEMRERARTEAQGYYAHCTALDRCVGDLQKTLKETGDRFLSGAQYLKEWGYTADKRGCIPYRGNHKVQSPANKSAKKGSTP